MLKQICPVMSSQTKTICIQDECMWWNGEDCYVPAALEHLTQRADEIASNTDETISETNSVKRAVEAVEQTLIRLDNQG